MFRGFSYHFEYENTKQAKETILIDYAITYSYLT